MLKNAIIAVGVGALALAAAPVASADTTVAPINIPSVFTNLQTEFQDAQNQLAQGGVPSLIMGQLQEESTELQQLMVETQANLALVIPALNGGTGTTTLGSLLPSLTNLQTAITNEINTISATALG